MSEEIKDLPPAEPAPPAETSPASDIGSIEGLLAEFDAATSARTGPSAAVGPVGFEAPFEQLSAQHHIDQAVSAERQRLGGELEAMLARDAHQRATETVHWTNELATLRDSSMAANARADQLQAAITEMAQQRWREKADDLGNKLVEERAQEYPDVPRDFLKAYYDSVAIRDPKFRELFINLLNGRDGAEWAFNSYHKKNVLQQLHRTISDRIDRDATEDRELVVQAVRGGATTSVPETPPPALGQMDNAGFRQHVRDQYGFDSGV